MFNKLGFRVAIQVNLVLLFVFLAGAWYLTSVQATALESQLLQRGRIESALGAKIVGKVLEEAIDNGALTVDDVFDRDYQLIPGFTPPKYHTRYDIYLDKAILALQDEFLKDDSVVFAAAVDIKGYLPTHNTPFNQPPTGDAKVDLDRNRTKRIFNDKIGISAATNSTPGFHQVYQRDTGEIMWDISSPIYVKGKHWGGFRIGFSIAKTEEAKAHLRAQLGLIMGGILLISTILVLLVVNTAIRPLTQLTNAASDLADGRIGTKISSPRKDEIGQLADVLERLRVSIEKALKRLKQG